MNSILTIVLCVLLGFFAVRFFQMNQINCDAAEKNTDIQVTLEMPEPVMNTELSTAKISRKSRNLNQGSGFSSLGITMGLTEANWKTRFNVHTQEHKKTFSGQLCLTPEKVEIRLKLEQTIYLGNDVIRTQCQIKQLMDHEMRHAEINRDMARKHTDKFKAAAQQAIGRFGVQEGFGPYPPAHSAARQKKLLEYVDGAVQQTLASKESETNALHRQIDTMAEYRRVSMACDW